MGWVDKYSEDISKAQKGKFIPKREGFSRTQDNTAVDSKLFSKINKDKKFKNKLTTEQQNQKAYQESKLQGEKELAKNWAQSSMQEAFKHPLMSPGYFTPEGVAVAALQGAVKLGPDLYNEEYLGAAEDALMMLPFAPKGFQAAKQAGKFLTEETALKNAYKLNPKAFKPKPDSYYRALGDTGYQDALESGVLRPKQTATDNWMMNNTDNRGKTWFSKGELITARDNPNILLGYKGPDMVEYSGKNLTESIPKRNRVYGSSDSQIPIDSKDVQFYREDWLKGYKKMPKNNFKSEIDWNSFNKSIPKNKLLMQEYNTIEQQAKANGSWMKNADGTQYTLSDGYVGSPEQFVQENSKNYKLAFGDKRPDTVYRGVQEGTTGDFSLSDEMGLAKERGMFTANKELADNYGASQGNPKLLSAFDEGNAGTYQLASKNNTQLTIDANAGSWTDIDLMPNYNKKDLAFNLKSGENQLAVLRDDLSQDPEMLVNYAQGIERKRRLLNGVDDLSYNNPEYKKLTDALGPESDTNEIAKYLQNTELNKFRINNVNDGGLGDVTIHNNKKGNYLKSLIGNNGEFDMNNPNIFKAIAPIIPAAGVAVAAQMQGEEVPQYQDGGEIQHQMPDGSMMDGNSHDDYNTAMRGMMKSKIGMGNTFNNPAIKRMSQSYPKQGMTPEGMGTHYMGSYGNEARPSLQDFGGEQLQYIENPKKGSPENIRFDRSQDAEYFAEHYKEVAPMTTIFKDVNKMQNGGGIIKDDRGQWDHPGKITQIQGGDITMKGVNYPVLGIADNGEQQMMYPEQDYNFEGAEYVNEYPMMSSVPKAQKGKTITVNSKNDPRYKAYQDSLLLHNATRGSIDKLKTVTNKQDWFNYNKDWGKKFMPTALPAAERLTKLNKKQPSHEKYLERFNKSSYAGEFKKPTQPVELQKEVQKKIQQRSLINPIQSLVPQGIQKSDFELEVGTPQIRQQAIVPKSFDVDYSAERMNGGKGYYDGNNQQGVSADVALRAIKQSDRQNAYWENTYGKSSNPKAKERLKQLKETTTISPNYKAGGNLKKSTNFTSSKGWLSKYE
jgi:hypothetical protein